MKFEKELESLPRSPAFHRSSQGELPWAYLQNVVHFINDLRLWKKNYENALAPGIVY